MTERVWQCPFCKTEIPSDAPECPECHRSLDWKAAANREAAAVTRVVITGVDIPMGALATLMFELFIASIPVAVVAGVLIAVLFGIASR